MELLSTKAAVNQFRETIELSRQSLGFVPTMGALHSGHLSIVERAKKENERVAVSIFVNPIQFNNAQDLKNYPRILDQDLDLLQPLLDKEDLVFCPTENEMYPEKVSRKFNFGPLEQVMEGAHRPGHFNGVAVVVDLLFSLFRPRRSYFGEKDFQQLAIIRQLVEQEQHATDIVPCAIIREADGLAMSSRNIRLSRENRKKAPLIYQQLTAARQQMEPGKDLRELTQQITRKLNGVDGFSVDYVCFAEEQTLQAVDHATIAPFRCFIAAYAGDVRLIDNLSMNEKNISLHTINAGKHVY